VVIAAIATVIVVVIFARAVPQARRSAGGAQPPAPGNSTATTPITTTPSRPAASAAAQTAAEATSRLSARAVAWAAANLSHQASIVSDPATVAILRDAGFAAATTFAAAAHAAPPTLDYVLTRSGVSPAPSARAVVDTALPLAIFGQGSARVTVGQLFPAGRAAARRQLERDTRQRISGGQELTNNKALVANAAAHAALLDGDLDLRAQNVCNVLTTTGRIWLTVNGQSAAEKRAQLPIRSITVTAQHPSAMQVTLAGLVPPFRPTIVTISPDTVRLTWPPQIDPVQIVGN
jgi:hypothetical protein